MPQHEHSTTCRHCDCHGNQSAASAAAIHPTPLEGRHWHGSISCGGGMNTRPRPPENAHGEGDLSGHHHASSLCKEVCCHGPRSCTCRESLSEVDVLQLKVRALAKYKTNYELLCGQLAELNTQIGLQLQRHDADIATLQATIATLQDANQSLALSLQTSEAQLASQRGIQEKDAAIASRLHQQVESVTTVLAATKKRLEEQEQHATDEQGRLHSELRHVNDQLTQLQAQQQDQQREFDQKLKTAANTNHDTELTLSNKHRTEMEALRQELQHLEHELRASRATCRQYKQLHKQLRDDKEVVSRQLAGAKMENAHLSELTQVQRVDLQRREKKCARWRKTQHEAERALQVVQAEREELQAQLVQVNEQLVAKNSQLEALQLALRAQKKTLEMQHADHDRAQREEIATLKKQVDALNETQQQQQQQNETQAEVSNKASQQEKDAFEVQRRHHKELQRMRHLLTVNQQRTTESSRDMQVLKQELSSVQELLRRGGVTEPSAATHRCRRRHRPRYDESDGESDERSRYEFDPDRVEKSVLESAIMQQVQGFTPSPA